MGRWRILIAGLWLAWLSTQPGCALLHPERAASPNPELAAATEAALNAGCDRPFKKLLPLLGPCGDLNPLQPGRQLTLSECVGSALKNGRVGDENIGIRTHEAALVLTKTRALGSKGRLQSERIWLTLEQGTQDLILAVETAYWGLVQARYNLGAREEALEALEEEAINVRARYEERLLTRQDLDTLEEQRQLGRVDLLEAQSRVREAERVLRRTSGMPPDDGYGLVPITEPARHSPVTNGTHDLESARSFLPELALARLEVEIACQDLLALKDEKARPQAILKVERDQVALRNAEEEMVFALQKSQRQVTQAWESYRALELRENAARNRLEASNEKWQSKEFGDLRELLQARTGYTTARRETRQALIEYQLARAELLRRNGRLLQYHHVEMACRDPRPTPGE